MTDQYMKLVIDGVPLPQQRPRLFRRGTKNIVFDAQSREKILIRRKIQEILDNRESDWIFPVNPRISFKFFMPIPKSLVKKDREDAEQEILKHTKKPDVDNLIKLYLDVLTSLVIGDDNCVSLGRAVKLYSTNPRTEIFIEETERIISMRELYG